MTGSIRKRGNKWTIVFYLGKDENGKPKYKWKGGYRTKTEARKALNIALAEAQTGNYIEVSKMPLGQYLNEWFEGYSVNLAPSTARGYRVNIQKHINPSLGFIRLCDLYPLQIQKFYNQKIKEGLSPTTVIYMHRVLHKALKQAVKLRMIRFNPVEDMELPKKKQFKAQVLNEEQVKKMLNTAKKTSAYIPILLAVGLGLRRGEVLGLMWEDIDFDQNIIHIRRNAVTVDKVVQVGTPKSKTSRRSILVSSKKIQILKNHMEKNPDIQYVVTGADGQIYSSSILNDRFKELLQNAGLPNVRFHDLRHTFATIGLRKGIHPKVMSGILGHSTIGITMNLYSHLDISMQESAVSIVDDEI